MITVSTHNQADLGQLITLISHNLNPDLRDLTLYVRQLELPKYNNANNALDTARNLAQFVDLPLIEAIQQINDYKEIEAPLADLKDSSLRSMSSILDALAKRAVTRSIEAGGAYFSLFHVFYDEFGPNRTVARNTFYAYRSALTRYALKRVSDLAPHLPANVDKERAGKSFIRAIVDEGNGHSNRPTAPNVDKQGADREAASAITVPHPLTAALYSAANFVNNEVNHKLSVYPWFASKRLPRSGQVPPTLTNLEVIELAECLRFICHYAPDLKFERRGFLASNKRKEFDIRELISDGCLLNAPQPKFAQKGMLKKTFDRMKDEEKKKVSKKNKRIASTAFDPSAFWLDVTENIEDDQTKAAIAAQLISGCRPSELIDGMLVAPMPTAIKNSTGKLVFWIFGTKDKLPQAADAVNPDGDAQSAYKEFLKQSSVARNSQTRGQFFHSESYEVMSQFPERTWLFSYLSGRVFMQRDIDRRCVETFLNEKLCKYQRFQTRKQKITPQQTPMQGHLQEGPRQASQNDEQTATSLAGKRIANATPEVLEVDFEERLAAERAALVATQRPSTLLAVSILQTAQIIRFNFTPKASTFPLMVKYDGIRHQIADGIEATNEVRDEHTNRIWLLNEFTNEELDRIAVPPTHRAILPPADFAALKKERASYRATAVVRLSERYQSASNQAEVHPSPYLARHRLLSDLKGIKDEKGTPAMTPTEIARKAGHSSTYSQTGYGKAGYAEKGSRNRAHGILKIEASAAVKNPSPSQKIANEINRYGHSGGQPPPKYEPKD